MKAAARDLWARLTRAPAAHEGDLVEQARWALREGLEPALSYRELLARIPSRHGHVRWAHRHAIDRDAVVHELRVVDLLRRLRRRTLTRVIRWQLRRRGIHPHVVEGHVAAWWRWAIGDFTPELLAAIRAGEVYREQIRALQERRIAALQDELREVRPRIRVEVLEELKRMAGGCPEYLCGLRAGHASPCDRRTPAERAAAVQHGASSGDEAAAAKARLS